MCLEKFYESQYQEILLINGLCSIFNLMVMLSTLSADSFFEFLFCYFIEVSIQVFERLYLELAFDQSQDWIIEQVSNKYQQFLSFFRRSKGNNDEGADDEDDEGQEEGKLEQSADQNEANNRDHAEEAKKRATKKKLEEESESDIILSERVYNSDSDMEIAQQIESLKQNQLKQLELAEIQRQDEQSKHRQDFGWQKMFVTRKVREREPTILRRRIIHNEENHFFGSYDDFTDRDLNEKILKYKVEQKIEEIYEKTSKKAPK